MALIKVENTAPTPNAVFAPMIQMMAGVVDGKLVTSCQITLCSAKVTNEGTASEKWERAGEAKTIFIPDINKLDADLSPVQSKVDEAYAGLKSLISFMNSVKKVI